MSGFQRFDDRPQAKFIDLNTKGQTQNKNIR